MTTVLVTGVNAGIGNGLIKKYLLRPNTTVIGSVRDATAPKNQELYSLPTAEGSKLILLSIESASETSAAEAVSTLPSKGIEKLDIVIANAGMFKYSSFAPVATAKSEDILEHMNVNVVGVVRLFQATLPLMNKAENPRFALISSLAGSIASQKILQIPATSYGASKAMLNFIGQKIHLENPNITTLILHPGAVLTDRATDLLGQIGALEKFEGISVEESVDGLVARIDVATRQLHSGEFQNYNGLLLPW